MSDLRINYNKVTLFLVLAVIFILNVSDAQVVCNKFELVTNVTGPKLDILVDTDLPDNTTVMVSVWRTYKEDASSDDYVVYYFSENSTLGKWKSKHTISIDSEIWKTALRKKQERMARMGDSFGVASISDKIAVHATVPINQTDPRFGERNSRLSGNAVTMASKGGKTVTGKVVGPMYVVEDEEEIDYPLGSPTVGSSPFPNMTQWNELEAGQVYIVSKQTPLMPSHSPDSENDVYAALEKMKQIPESGSIKVLKIFYKEGTPWYMVSAFDQGGYYIGVGWVNGKAFLSQQLYAYKEPKTATEKPPVTIIKTPKSDKTSSINLRSSYRDLSVSQVQSIPNISIRKKTEWGFFGHSTINHSYEKQSVSGDRVVVDHATGLMWHQNGSDKFMKLNGAKDWVRSLNRGYAGYNDWRLPTLEEAVSLLESSKKNDLYIASVFSKKQWGIWTGDIKSSSKGAWIIDFSDSDSDVYWCGIDGYNYVRPVRSISEENKQGHKNTIEGGKVKARKKDKKSLKRFFKSLFK